ncbi:uncharacterized protein LOC130757010 [Actinidia eriantha]|uniref:uncharacterized protein LOC130757010 n=1 Tax=Actinidia eriantha TaxID=165200 RepID=UPI0025899C3E|nr:uncharacterized protein LOC130757010 [Actinidia eriantha]
MNADLSQQVQVEDPCKAQAGQLPPLKLRHWVQVAMENMLKMINEIDENSTGIMEEIAKCKDNALEKKKTLEEWKESFQKAASTVLDMLNNNDIR